MPIPSAPMPMWFPPERPAADRSRRRPDPGSGNLTRHGATGEVSVAGTSWLRGTSTLVAALCGPVVATVRTALRTATARTARRGSGPADD